MTYKEFYTEAVKGLENWKSIDKDTMEFAYIMFHLQFGEEPKKAIESSLLLNTL
jgi:hypothetical protein